MFIESQRSAAAPQRGAMSVATKHGRRATRHMAPLWGAALRTTTYL